MKGFSSFFRLRLWAERSKWRDAFLSHFARQATNAVGASGGGPRPGMKFEVFSELECFLPRIGFRENLLESHSFAGENKGVL